MKDLITQLKATKLDNRVRLGIMSILMVDDWVDFKTLKERLGVSDGNLASHIKVLESMEYISVKKEFVGRKPQTTYQVTDLGKAQFNAHLNALEALLKQKG